MVRRERRRVETRYEPQISVNQYWYEVETFLFPEVFGEKTKSEEATEHEERFQIHVTLDIAVPFIMCDLNENSTR